MLSILHPEIHAHIKNKFHIGLWPFQLTQNGKFTLIIKAPKEALLATKLRKYFKIFLAPIKIGGRESFSLISAFYDDDDDPLTVTTPLFIDPLTDSFQKILLSNKVDVYFFDENGVEF